MSDTPTKHYAQRDVELLGQFYVDHVAAMTAEGLHDKSAIAAELAWRDARIAELEAGLREIRDNCPCDNDGQSCPCEGTAGAVLASEMLATRSTRWLQGYAAGREDAVWWDTDYLQGRRDNTLAAVDFDDFDRGYAQACEDTLAERGEATE